MSLKRTVHTAITSYAGLGSAILSSLLMVRLATQTLSQGEFGLWSFTMQSIGYFLLLDFGIGNSLGRLFGEPLASKDQREINRWFTLAVGILSIQGLVILGVGLLSRDWVLTFFRIPTALRGDASLLWTTMLILQAINLPFRVTGAILHAQNRNYLSNLFPVIGAWAGFAVFYFMLKSGAGVISYAWASGTTVAISASLGTLAVLLGPHRFGINIRGISRKQLMMLFSFASGVFVVGIAVQVEFASQGLILTKLIGLDAAAIYQVTSRVPFLLMQVLFRPFDAFTPRWQQAYCDGNTDSVAREFTAMTRVSILLGAAAACGVILANPAFVRWWTKPEYFGGTTLNSLLAIWLVVQIVMHCYSYAFGLHKKMGVYAAVVCLNVAAQVGFAICLVGIIGISGVIVSSLAVGWLGLYPFILIKGSGLLSVVCTRDILRDFLWWVPFVTASIFLAARLGYAETIAGVLIASAVSAAIGSPAALRALYILKARHRPLKRANNS